MKRFITYQEYGTLVDLLTNVLLNSDKNFFVVTGPPRGALPILTHLSHHLNKFIIPIDSIMNVPIQQDILLVDDICDTGKTFELYKRMYNKVNFVTASLFYKPHSTILPDYFIKTTEDWIVFPWEKQDEIPNRSGYETL